MVGLAFAVAASCNFPVLLMSIMWRGHHDLGRARRRPRRPRRGGRHGGAVEGRLGDDASAIPPRCSPTTTRRCSRCRSPSRRSGSCPMMDTVAGAPSASARPSRRSSCAPRPGSARPARTRTDRHRRRFRTGGARREPRPSSFPGSGRTRPQPPVLMAPITNALPIDPDASSGNAYGDLRVAQGEAARRIGQPSVDRRKAQVVWEDQVMAVATAIPRTDGAPRPMSSAEKRVIFASSLGTVFEWYDFYLYGSLAAIIGAQFFSAYPPATRDIFALLAFAAGFIVRPVRRPGLRPPRRSGRAQVHLPRHDPDHGPVDVHRRRPAERRHHRHRGTDHPDRPAPGAGPGAGRRVRRGGDLRGRARPQRPARLLHELDPDHRDARPVPVAARDPGDPQLHRRGGLRRMGLAHPVPGLGAAARQSPCGSACSSRNRRPSRR